MMHPKLVCSLLVLLVAACGAPSSDPSDGGNDKVDAGPPPEDQCQGTEDLAWLQEDVDAGVTGREQARAAASECGKYYMSHATPDVEAVKCMREAKWGVELSDGCATCYGGIVLCTIEKCINRCFDDPQSDDCKACQDEKGCQGVFDTCTGPLDAE